MYACHVSRHILINLIFTGHILISLIFTNWQLKAINSSIKHQELSKSKIKYKHKLLGQLWNMKETMKSSCTLFFLILFVVAVSAFAKKPDIIPFDDEALSFLHYHRSCPEVERIIHNTVKKWVAKDYTLAPAIMRLHFHDCAIRVRISVNCYLEILLRTCSWLLLQSKIKRHFSFYSNVTFWLWKSFL